MGRRLSVVVLLFLLLVSACVPPQGIDRVVAPYAQDTIRGHIEGLLARFQMGLQSGPPVRLPVEEEIAIVQEYFTLAGQIRRLRGEIGNVRAHDNITIEALTAQLTWARQRRDHMRAQVEEVISRQVGEALSEAGLNVALGPEGPDWFFPPAQFFLTQSPYVLVTSPRDRIDIKGSYLLGPQLNTADMDDIERLAEKDPGVSALVERTGGFSLYPAWVSDNHSLRDTLNIVAHEWTHAYLFLFYPLGRAYFQDYDMRTLNESVADIVGNEIGAAVYRRYYAPTTIPISSVSAKVIVAREYDFATHMRSIRSSVEGMLARGRIEDAEAYMEGERQELNTRGYAVRRLNQAYLALHGNYAASAAFEAPTGTSLKDIRARSSSLGEFVRRVGAVSSYGEFRQMIE